MDFILRRVTPPSQPVANGKWRQDGADPALAEKAAQLSPPSSEADESSQEHHSEGVAPRKQASGSRGPVSKVQNHDDVDGEVQVQLQVAAGGRCTSQDAGAANERHGLGAGGKLDKIPADLQDPEAAAEQARPRSLSVQQQQQLPQHAQLPPRGASQARARPSGSTGAAAGPIKPTANGSQQRPRQSATPTGSFNTSAEVDDAEDPLITDRQPSSLTASQQSLHQRLQQQRQQLQQQRERQRQTGSSGAVGSGQEDAAGGMEDGGEGLSRRAGDGARVSASAHGSDGNTADVGRGDVGSTSQWAAAPVSAAYGSGGLPEAAPEPAAHAPGIVEVKQENVELVDEVGSRGLPAGTLEGHGVGAAAVEVPRAKARPGREDEDLFQAADALGLLMQQARSESQAGTGRGAAGPQASTASGRAAAGGSPSSASARYRQQQQQQEHQQLMLAPMEDEAEARNGRPYGDAGLGQSSLPFRRAPNVQHPGADEDELYDAQGRWPDRQQQQQQQQQVLQQQQQLAPPLLQLHPHDRSMGGSSARSSAYDGAGSPVLLSVGPDGVLQLAPLPGSRAAGGAGPAQPARRPAAAAANGAAPGVSAQQGHVTMPLDPPGGAGGAQLVRLYDNGAVALHLDDADVDNGPVAANGLGGGGGVGVGMGQGRLGGYGGSRGLSLQDLHGGLQLGGGSARVAAAGGGGGNAAAVMRLRQQLQQLKEQVAQLEEEVECVPPGKVDLLQEHIMQLQQEQQQLRGSLLPLNQQQQLLRLAQLQQQRREQLGAVVQGGMDWERGGIPADPAAELLRLQQQQQQRRALLLSALTGGGLGGLAAGAGVGGATELGLSGAEVELRLVRQQLLLQQQQQQQSLDYGAGLGGGEDLGVVAALRRQLQLQREQLQRERLRQLQQLQRGEELYEEPVGAGRGGGGGGAGAGLRLGGYDQQGSGLPGGLRGGQAQGLGLQRRETGAMDVEVDAMDLTGDGVDDVGPGEGPQLVSLVREGSGNAGRLGSRPGAGLVLQPLQGGRGAGREAQVEDNGAVRGRLVQQPLAGSEAAEEQNQARRHGRPPKPRAAAEEEAAAAVRPQRAARRTAAYERGLAAELYDSDEDKLIGPADGGLADRNSRDGDAGQPGPGGRARASGSVRGPAGNGRAASGGGSSMAGGHSVDADPIIDGNRGRGVGGSYDAARPGAGNMYGKKVVRQSYDGSSADGAAEYGEAHAGTAAAAAASGKRRRADQEAGAGGRKRGEESVVERKGGQRAGPGGGHRKDGRGAGGGALPLRVRAAKVVPKVTITAEEAERADHRIECKDWLVRRGGQELSMEMVHSTLGSFEGVLQLVEDA